MFDLTADGEWTDLLDQHPDVATRLRGVLDAHNAEQAEPLWRSVIDMPQQIDKHGEEPFVASDEYIYWPN